MLTQNVNVKLEGSLWVAFQLFAERVCLNGVNKKTPDVFKELIKETPEYAKITGIPAVQEQAAPVVENLSSVNGKEQNTDSSAESQ